MSGRLAGLIVVILSFTQAVLLSQSKSAFSGDLAKFGSELTTYMGPNLNPKQTSNLDLFLVRWDSAFFSKQNMARIADISTQLSSRLMRPVPHFNDFLTTINDFTDHKIDPSFFTNWLIGLSEMIFGPGFNNDNIDRYFRNTSSMIKENVIFDSGTVKWKVKNNTPQYLHDTIFCVSISNATLTCYSQRDSTEIYNVTGIYYPQLQQFRGSKGLITWEKAGSPRNNTFAELGKYTINTTKNSFTIDSAKLTNKSYFKEPVYGSISDQTSSYSNMDKAIYPRFTTYIKKFVIKNLYEGINYKGGLSFDGASVKGIGEKFVPAEITLFRHDTLYLRINSKEFLFSKTGLNSQESSVSLYIGKDSIYHSSLAMSYIASSKQINLFRTNNPNSKSPYFNSYHSLDMYFEYLSWNLNESKIILSRPRGSSMGQAQFESSSFFNSNEFLRLMGLDDYHPLNRLIKFAEWYYSEKFPVTEFAKWLNKPVEAVIGLCIDLANNGFIYYDRSNNEVTIKQKTKDFLAAYAKKKDYDIINIVSKTKSPVDNAILDLKTFDLTVNGVSGVFLSDSQRVAIYPYSQKLIIGKNRSLHFDGAVEAGLFTIFGQKFSFNYDTFKIRLQKIDSIKFAMETDQKDLYGHPLALNVDNLIQIGKGELFIDNPSNKSGLKSYKQYPIINSTSYSYIFYDKIPGLENMYKQKDFYFKVDPFKIENIDHYKKEDVNFPGEFYGGKITEPMRQYLTVQENNSLGFNMTIPKEGIEVYKKKGRLFDAMNMSNLGLIGSGTLQYLSSTAKSEKFSFFPDSMITKASKFDIKNDGSGIFPDITSQDVGIKWFPDKDQYLATNTSGKSFSLFENGTTLDGTLILTPSILKGMGIINMPESRITSDLYSFAPNSIRADTADYNLKSKTTSGYSFIAENAKTDINFGTRIARFRLNTDASMVKFPEIQYICTMTDFVYNMESRVLNMEHKGKSDTPLLPTDKLLRLDLKNLDKPTFFATNNLSDTVAFSSWKASYNLDKEIIEAENINYIHIADALIQPENGKIIINRRAKIEQLQNAIIALNNRHILHSAKIDIESTKRYTGSAIYDYVNADKEVQQITFPELSVDTLTTTAKGFIPITQNFMLSPAFSFSGDVTLSAHKDLLSYTGSAGIVQNCSGIKSYPVKFKAEIDPKNVMIPISDKPRDTNDNLIFSGSFISTDSTQIYPAFLSAQKTWTDVPLVNASGWLLFDKSKGRYLITSLEKLADQNLSGNMIALDKNFCVLSGEGNLNFGVKYDLVNFAGAGNVIHSIDSGKVNIEAILALDFFFSDEALKMMADEIRMMPSLKPVNLNSGLINKGMQNLMGAPAASKLKEEMDLFGTARNLSKENSYKLLLNDVHLYWNEASSSFRSRGKIGLGFVGPQPVNVYVDGYIEIQRRRSGDMIDVYLKADGSVWYYFSYFRGVMMSQAGNNNYNILLNNIKLSDRKHPESTVRVPYTYMISSEDRLSRFLRRMESDNPIEDPSVK